MNERAPRMSIEMLRRYARAIYGEQWQAPLARDLGVAERTVRRWEAEEQRPPDVSGELAEICRRKADRLGRIATEIERERADH